MRRLLIVDSDAGARDVIRRRLNPLYTLSYAPTQQEAWRVLRHHVVHLALLESRLPDGSGLDLLARIRQEHPDLPTIMVTGYGSEAVCASAFKLGVVDYLTKPIDPIALVEAVEKAIGNLPTGSALPDHVFSARAREATTSVSPAKPMRREQRISQAVTFIHEHYREHVTLPDVARVVGMGKFALSHAFSAVMQESFRTHLLKFRVARAADLLGDPTHSVTDIAGLVGFGDLSRFNKAFKKYVGVPPTAYRKRRSARNARGERQ